MEAGLPVPETIELTASEVQDHVDRIRFPIVVKPPATVVRSDGRIRSLSVVPVRDGGALLEAMAKVPPGESRLIQPWITGTLYAVCGVSWGSDVVCSFHQVSPRIWPPVIGGSSYASGAARDERVESGVGRLMSALGWSGLFCVQFLQAEGCYWLIDVNPRVYGSLALAVAAGYNLPTIWADLVLGRRPRLPPAARAVRFRAEEDDVRAIVHAVRATKQLRALCGLLPRRHTVHSVWSWRDPRPAVTTFQKLIRRATRRRPSSVRS